MLERDNPVSGEAEVSKLRYGQLEQILSGVFYGSDNFIILPSVISGTGNEEVVLRYSLSDGEDIIDTYNIQFIIIRGKNIPDYIHIATHTSLSGDTEDKEVDMDDIGPVSKLSWDEMGIRLTAKSAKDTHTKQFIIQPDGTKYTCDMYDANARRAQLR